MIDYERALAKFNADAQQRCEVANEFFSSRADVERYALGRNAHALTCGQWVRLNGIVDDFYRSDATWSGYPVIASDRLVPGAIVINCSMSIRPVSAHTKLAGKNGVRVLSYADLTHADPEFPIADFVACFRSDFAANSERWRWLEGRLADRESCSVLNSLMLYRLTGDYRHMSSFSVRLRDQYFDPVVSLSPSEVFVDCGGYDGDTVLEYFSRNHKYKKIYVFEPSPPNFERARARLAGYENISLIPLAVSESKRTLSFDATAGSASSVSASGSTSIEAVAIDEYISEPVSYVKMDLEGHELAALKGAKEHIVRDHPKLAVSVYHDPSDFWRIPEYVLGLRDDYVVHLRHYTEGWSETVMYFIPRVAA